MTIGTVDVSDRCPICLAVGSVNPPGGCSDFPLNVGIFRDLCSALRGDLQVGHFPPPLGLSVEKPLKCRKPLRNAFRVVQSIDPNDKRAIAETFDDPLN